ncbi:uncharacterized protein EI97DRAFT_178789 [Westerdykella ornata]|uniref:Uncharacterized protein n=1 Tax=Westerdykella ornata TaxID=318751 RepID=A0A6A6JTD4_WESOR|nr:uncharacterized protein EI97DRAFT_178789 [Westerdykella ornata]KAF2279525.1 hypothetical protein EI97DRAFT_178789 [Westerdykella ornata]
MEFSHRDATEASRDPPPKLKCPFYQRNPRAHPKASCKNTCYSDMFRLVQHLKRVHAQAPGCECCPRALKKAPCQRMDAKIKSIKLNDPRFQNQTREKKWDLVFEILFPGIPVPLPSEQEGLTHEEESIFLQLFVKRLRKHLGPAAAITLDDVEELYYDCKRKARSSVEQTNQEEDDSMDEADPSMDTLNLRDAGRSARAVDDPNRSSRSKRLAHTGYDEEERTSRSREKSYSTSSIGGNPIPSRTAQGSSMQTSQTFSQQNWTPGYSPFAHPEEQMHYQQQGYLQQVNAVYQQNTRPTPSSTNPRSTPYGYPQQQGNPDTYGNQYQQYNWHPASGM